MIIQQQGQVHVVSPVEIVGDNLQKRQLVLAISEKGKDDAVYESFLAADALGEKVDALDGLVKGQSVTLHYTVRSRSYQDRWFTNVNVFRVETGSNSTASTAPVSEDNDNSPDEVPF